MCVATVGINIRLRTYCTRRFRVLQNSIYLNQILVNVRLNELSLAESTYMYKRELALYERNVVVSRQYLRTQLYEL